MLEEQPCSQSYMVSVRLDYFVYSLKGIYFAVGNGAILDIILDNFTYGPPSGFERILLEQSLL